MREICSLEEIFNLAHDTHKLCQYGLGVEGIKFEYYREHWGIDVDYYCDQDSEKVGEKGEKGISIDELGIILQKEICNVILTVNEKHRAEIAKDLEQFQNAKLLYINDSIIPDELFLKEQYKRVMGRELNLDNPQTATEKLQWYKLYYHDDMFTKMADKYEVKELYPI